MNETELKELKADLVKALRHLGFAKVLRIVTEAVKVVERERQKEFRYAAGLDKEA